MDALVVKYCPACDTANLPTESFCTHCDFDLLNVPSEPRRELLDAAQPAPAEEAAPADTTATTCRLELVEDSAVAFRVAPGQTVGRGVEADVLLKDVPHLGYISRRHAQFLQRGDQWYVQYVASGNFLKVDGEKYEDDSLVALHDGSILTLSLTSFRVVLA